MELGRDRRETGMLQRLSVVTDLRTCLLQFTESNCRLLAAQQGERSV